MSETVALPRIRVGEPRDEAVPTGRIFGLYEQWRVHVPLLFVLVAQSCIALTLSNSAFIDEGCYLFSGHSEWAALFGGPTPDTDYPTYFSGSPYLYPLIGAIANALGGLGAARGLSLFFMLGATVMLYRATKLFFGRGAAVWAAALFALSGPALFMSHLATFDAPAVFLLATGLWYAIRSSGNKVLFLEATVLIVLAAAFKYATLVYAVPVVAVAAICSIPKVGWRWAAVRAAVLGSLFAVLAFGLLCLAGPPTVTGLVSTTLNRPPATNTTAQILQRSAVYVGFLFVLGAAGALWFTLRPSPSNSTPPTPTPRPTPTPTAALTRTPAPASAPAGGPLVANWSWRVRALLAAVLLGSALIAPLGDVRLHTLTSLEKHAGYGLLLAAPMAGWLLDRLAGRSLLRTAPVLAVVAALGVFGANQAHQFFGEWLTSTAYVHEFESVAAKQKQGTNILVEDPWVSRYYLGGAGTKLVWHDTYAFQFTADSGASLTGLPAYEAAITERYFGVVVIDYQATPSLDPHLDQTLATSGYQRTAVPAYDRYGTVEVEIWTLIGAAK
jgi:4-amino-4-deoxy-L-arabinose transferase-like glycosyltransferase